MPWDASHDKIRGHIVLRPAEYNSLWALRHDATCRGHCRRHCHKRQTMCILDYFALFYFLPNPLLSASYCTICCIRGCSAVTHTNNYLSLHWFENSAEKGRSGRAKLTEYDIALYWSSWYISAICPASVTQCTKGRRTTEETHSLGQPSDDYERKRISNCEDAKTIGIASKIRKAATVTGLERVAKGVYSKIVFSCPRVIQDCCHAGSRTTVVTTAKSHAFRAGANRTEAGSTAVRR